MRSPIPIDTDLRTRCIDTLEAAFDLLQHHRPDDPLYDILRAASVKEFEPVPYWNRRRSCRKAGPSAEPKS